MKSEELDSFIKPLIEHRLLSVEKKDWTWFFGFTAGVSVATEAPWRLIDNNLIVTSSEDHGQRFGLAALVDAALEVLSRTAGHMVEAVSISPDSGDLTIQFHRLVQLQLLQLSSGYESWRLAANGSEIICTGGGGIAHFPQC